MWDSDPAIPQQPLPTLLFPARSAAYQKIKGWARSGWTNALCRRAQCRTLSSSLTQKHSDLFATAQKGLSPFSFYKGVGPYPAFSCFQQRSSDPSRSACSPSKPGARLAGTLTCPSYSCSSSGRAGSSSPRDVGIFHPPLTCPGLISGLGPL